MVMVLPSMVAVVVAGGLGRFDLSSCADKAVVTSMATSRTGKVIFMLNCFCMIFKNWNAWGSVIRQHGFELVAL
jgi:F0F1-type ATP synthase assembly protein I